MGAWTKSSIRSVHTLLRTTFGTVSSTLSIPLSSTLPQRTLPQRTLCMPLAKSRAEWTHGSGELLLCLWSATLNIVLDIALNMLPSMVLNSVLDQRAEHHRAEASPLTHPTPRVHLTHRSCVYKRLLTRQAWCACGRGHGQAW